MMALKQLAWIMRNASGDASLCVTNAIAGLPNSPDAMALYTGYVGKTDGAWVALQGIVAGMSLPAGLKASIDTVKREFYGRDYLELRTKILKAKIAGTDPGITMESGRHFTIAKLALVVMPRKAPWTRQRITQRRNARPLSNRSPCKAGF